ncbi:MAG: ATP-binding protein [Planctomycetota bacterium]|nr:ATP-binding protein [Planctomycetota bacterium]
MAMGSGIIANGVVCAAAAAGAAACAWLSLGALSAWSEGARLGVIGAGAFAGAAAALGALMSVRVGAEKRLIARLREAAGEIDPLSFPASLRSVAVAARDARRAWGAREAELAARLREAEVRANISEADRQHGEAILNTLRDAVIVTDSFNEVTLANAPAARLLGFDLDGAAHKPVDEVVRDEELRRMIEDVRRSGVVSKTKHAEHTLSPPQGGSASFDVTIAALPGAKEEVGGVVTILRDVTREKEISQMKSDFVSQASHELRTPISSINAYVEMLLDAETQDEAQRQEFYGVIKGEAERLSRMIDNMLNISRIEAGIVSVDRVEVDFAKLIRGVIETMAPQAKAKQIMLVEKIGPLIYTAESDRDMMHQVVMNLVSNAIKYTPEGGRVTVAVENDDASRSVLVSVSDTGLGIPPDALPRLFEKFFRIENYKRVAKGTGLGLNLVKHIVETVHRGQIGVTSQVGMGSRFWFTVPFEFQGG